MIDMEYPVEIKEYERVDDLHRNGYLIIQDPKRFCFGVDAVLLSGFANAGKDEILVDLGTGTGIIPILMEAKTEGKKFYGLEIQRESAEMAARSVKLNGLEDKIEIIHGDIKDAGSIFKPSSIDVITTNPPYMNSGGGLTNNYSPKAVARHEILVNLEDIARVSSKLLKFGGRFYMIHRPHRLTDIMCTLRKYKLEPKKVRFIQAYSHKEPAMVLIEASRSGRPMVKVLPSLIIYESPGVYTKEAFDIYYG